MRWTHGSLERDASLGLLMNDHPLHDTDGALRFDRGLAPYAATAAASLDGASAPALAAHLARVRHDH